MRKSSKLVKIVLAAAYRIMRHVSKMSTVLDQSLLLQARDRYLQEMLRELRLFSKRADGPEERAALAEMEREVLDVKERWKQSGMLNGTAQLEFAGANKDNGR